jgi:soluble P-type ATPase
MLEVTVPGYKTLRLVHLVLDFNGTLACDGRIIAGVPERLQALAKSLEIHVLTADTFGGVREEVAGIPCRLAVIAEANQAEAKASYVRALGVDHCVCVGNGRNDRLMLAEAVLGIAVLQREGGAVDALLRAHVAVASIVDALDLLLQPLRLAATLRS